MSSSNASFQKTIERLYPSMNSGYLGLDSNFKQNTVPQSQWINPFQNKVSSNPFLNLDSTPLPSQPFPPPAEPHTSKNDTIPPSLSNPFTKWNEENLQQAPTIQTKQQQQQRYEEKEEEKDIHDELLPSIPRYNPLAVPNTFIQTCQAALKEVNASSTLPSLPSPTFIPTNSQGRTYFSSSACDRKLNSSSQKPKQTKFENNRTRSFPNSMLHPWESNSPPFAPLDISHSFSSASKHILTNNTNSLEWKHRFPRGWYPVLKRFFNDAFPDTSQFHSFQMYIVDDDWSEVTIKGTSEVIQDLEIAIYDFVCLYSRSDLHVLYQPKENTITSATTKFASLDSTLVAWIEWPFQVTQDLDSSAYPFYALVQSTPSSTPYTQSLHHSSSSFSSLFKPPASSLSPPMWPHERIRSRQTADLFTMASFQCLMHQFHVYHTYFLKEHPFLFCPKLTGSLGKHIVSSDHLLSPNRPNSEFLLTSIQERYSRGTLRGSFAFNVWHEASVLYSTLTQRCGFTLQSSKDYLIMDLPSPKLPRTYARAKFHVQPNSLPTLKSIKTKDIVPIKLTLSFTDQVYDVRVRLVFKKTKEPIDLSELESKALFLLHHGTEQYYKEFGRCPTGLEEKLWMVQVQTFVHPTWPLKVKLSCWQSNKQYPSYYAIQCNYLPSSTSSTFNPSQSSLNEPLSDTQLEQQVLTFLEFLYKIAFSFPKKT